MPVEFGIWKINDNLERVHFSSIDTEAKLENVLARDITMLDPDLMVVGKQVPTDFGTFIDLLAVNSQGDLSVIELKRNKTPREVAAQALDYGSWVQNLGYEEIARIFSSGHTNQRFEEAFFERFGSSPPDSINQNHQLIIVASELDSSTERIITYLSTKYGVPINAVFFRYFRQESNEYLARTWLTDPNKLVSSKSVTQSWNGKDFYVALEEGPHRSWEDCVRYGFISAGQGRQYSRLLDSLMPSARVFAHIPGSGYVGVGVVKESSLRAKDFLVNVNGIEMPILSAPKKAPNMDDNLDDPEKSEYLVRVDWLKTTTAQKAVWKRGMFANQNIVCKLRNKFTLDTLIQQFGSGE